MTESKPMIRLFLAVDIPDHVRATLQEIQGRINLMGHFQIRWVRPDQMHLTLLFLGDTSVELLPSLRSALEDVAENVSPFELTVDGLGYFGSRRNPRVLWAGLGGALDSLQALYKGLADCVGATQPSQNDLAFNPHITLGRFRGGASAGALTSALSSISVGPLGSIAVDHVRLYQSELMPTGARYRILHSVMLKGEP